MNEELLVLGIAGWVISVACGSFAFYAWRQLDRRVKALDVLVQELVTVVPADIPEESAQRIEKAVQAAFDAGHWSEPASSRRAFVDPI